MYEFFWSVANRIRHLLHKPCQPRRCCKKLSNLKPFPIMPGRPDLTVTKCVVCNSRHFTVIADPGIIGVRGSGIG